MSFDVNWDIEKYKEDHESEDHWLLRRDFMDKWKHSYPEERLVCLSRVFANIEFMGCRYPQEVMQEVARMSKEVNKNLTLNNRNTNYFSEHERYHDSASAGPILPRNSMEAGQCTANPVLTTNIHSGVGSALNQNSTVECEYVWSQYSNEVMQGPVSISKVLQTTHSKSFIRENSNQKFFGNLTWHRSSRTDRQQPSSLSDFIDRTRLVKKNPSSNFARSESTLYHRREPKTASSLQDSYVNNTEIPQQGGVQSSKWQINHDLSPDHRMPMSHPTVGNTLNVDMQFRNPIKRSQDQTITNYDGHSHDDHMKLTNFGLSHDNMRNNDENFIQKPNTYPSHELVDSLSGSINCSEPIMLTQKPENPLPQSNKPPVVSNTYPSHELVDSLSGSINCSEPIMLTQKPENPLPQSNKPPVVSAINKATEHKNTTDKVSKKRNYKAAKRKNQLRGAASRRYKYWIHIGKTHSEARELSQVRLSKVPGYKEIKKTMGSASQYSSSFLKFAHKHWPGRNPPPPIAYKAFEKIYVPKIKKSIGVDAATNSMNASAGAIGTSNIGAATSNTSVTTSNIGASVKITGAILSNMGTVAERKAYSMEFEKRVMYWRSMGKSKKEARVLTRLSLEGNEQVKQLKAISTDTMMKKLAHKEHFKQFIKADAPPSVYTIDTSQGKKEAEESNVIDISDDDDKNTFSTDAGKMNAAKISIDKEMQEKRRIWWMQQGKTEEAAALCEEPMALERIPEHKNVMDKELLDITIPLTTRTQSNSTSIPTHQENISSKISELELHDNHTETDNAKTVRRGENLAQIKAKEDQSYHSSILTHEGNTSSKIPELEQRGCNSEADNSNKFSFDENLSLEMREDQNDPSIARHQGVTSLTIPEPDAHGNYFESINTLAVPTNTKANKLEIFVKDPNKPIGKTELLAFENAISQCVRDSKDTINILHIGTRYGCAVVTCVDEHSRDLLDKEIPSLAPWDGASLEVIDEIKIPSAPVSQLPPKIHIYSWVYVPIIPESGPLLKPGDTLKKLHKQNPKVGCDKWIVLHAQMQGDGQLLYVRFCDKSAKVLKSLDYKLKWYSSRPIRVKLKGKSKHQNTNTQKLVNKPVNQKKLANNPRLTNKNLINNSQNYENVLENPLNQEPIKSFPLIIISDDDSTRIPNVEDGNNVDLYINTAPKMAMQIGTKSFVGPSNPVEISSYAEMSLMAYASNNDARMPQLKVIAEPSTTIEWAEQSNQDPSLAMDQVKQASSQLENAHQQEITENGIVSEMSSEPRLRGENGSEIGRKMNLNLGEIRSCAVKNSRIKDICFWGVDAPRLLPAHRAAITKNDLQECDYEWEIGYFKDVGAFTGRDEEYSLEERVFAVRKQKCSREVKVFNGDQEYPRENKVLSERNQGCAQDRVITTRDQDCSEVGEFDEQNQGYSQDRFVTESQEYSREDRVFDERDQGTSQPIVVTELGQEYSWGVGVLDERYQENSQDRIATRHQDNYSEVRDFDGQDQIYSRNRMVTGDGQDDSRKVRGFDERDQISYEDTVDTGRDQENYLKNRDFTKRDQGYSQKDRVYGGQDKNNRKNEYSREPWNINEPSQEYSLQQRDLGERDQEYSSYDRHFDEQRQGYYREHRDFDKRDEESHENRVYIERVGGYVREDRFSAERGDQKYSRKGSVCDKLDQQHLRSDRGFNRRDQNYRREDRDYQPRDRPSSSHSAVSGVFIEDRFGTRRESESQAHFGRSEEPALKHQDYRISYTSDETAHRSRERSRGDDTKNRKSGAYVAQQKKRARF